MGSIDKGKWIVIIIIISLISVEIWYTVSSMTAVMVTDGRAAAIAVGLKSVIKLAGIGLFSFLMCIGYRWAKWIMSLVFGVAGIFLLIISFPNWVVIETLLPIVVYLTSASLLLFSPSVSAFVERNSSW